MVSRLKCALMKVYRIRIFISDAEASGELGNKIDTLASREYSSDTFLSSVTSSRVDGFKHNLSDHL
jgi:hypothetical protein